MNVANLRQSPHDLFRRYLKAPLKEETPMNARFAELCRPPGIPPTWFFKPQVYRPDLACAICYPAVVLKNWTLFNKEVANPFWTIWFDQLVGPSTLEFDYEHVGYHPDELSFVLECMAAEVNFFRPVERLLSGMGFTIGRDEHVNGLSLMKMERIIRAPLTKAATVCVRVVDPGFGDIYTCYHQWTHGADDVWSSNWNILMQEMSHCVAFAETSHYILTNYTHWFFFKYTGCTDIGGTAMCMYRHITQVNPSVRESIASFACLEPDPELRTLQDQIRELFHQNKRSMMPQVIPFDRWEFKDVIGYEYNTGTSFMDPEDPYSKLFLGLTHVDYFFDNVHFLEVEQLRSQVGHPGRCRIVALGGDTPLALEKVYDGQWLDESIPFEKLAIPGVAREWNRERFTFAANYFRREYRAYDRMHSIQGIDVPVKYGFVVTDPYSAHNERVPGILFQYMDGYISLQQFVIATLGGPQTTENYTNIATCQQTTWDIILRVHQCLVAHGRIALERFLIHPTNLSIVLTGFSHAVCGAQSKDSFIYDWHAWQDMWQLPRDASVFPSEDGPFRDTPVTQWLDEQDSDLSDNESEAKKKTTEEKTEIDMAIEKTIESSMSDYISPQFDMTML